MREIVTGYPKIVKIFLLGYCSIREGKILKGEVRNPYSTSEAP